MRIEVRNVTRRIDGRRLLDKIRLTVEPGRLLLLCGPNGAGKSTLLKVIAGLLPPTSGEVLFDEQTAVKAGPALRSRIGVLLHETALYDELTVMENLVFAGRLFGVPDVGAAARAMIDRVGLRLVAREPAGRMSHGMRQRLALGRALIHRPSVLLLDEPYAGLDVRWAGELTELLKEQLEAGTSIVLVAHEWRTAWAVADEVAVIVRGRLALHEEVSGYDPDRFDEDYRRLVMSGSAVGAVEAVGAVSAVGAGESGRRPRVLRAGVPAGTGPRTDAAAGGGVAGAGPRADVEAGGGIVGAQRKVDAARDGVVAGTGARADLAAGGGIGGAGSKTDAAADDGIAGPDERGAGADGPVVGSDEADVTGQGARANEPGETAKPGGGTGSAGTKETVS